MEQDLIALGRRGRDVITGFEGVITGHVAYLTGCNQYLLAPPAKDVTICQYDLMWGKLSSTSRPMAICFRFQQVIDAEITALWKLVFGAPLRKRGGLDGEEERRKRETEKSQRRSSDR
jgi:hypothetical protein